MPPSFSLLCLISCYQPHIPIFSNKLLVLEMRTNLVTCCCGWYCSPGTHLQFCLLPTSKTKQKHENLNKNNNSNRQKETGRENRIIQHSKRVLKIFRNYLLNVIRNLSFVSSCCGEKFCIIYCVVATLQAVVVALGGGGVVVWRGGGGV